MDQFLSHILGWVIVAAVVILFREIESRRSLERWKSTPEPSDIARYKPTFMLKGLLGSSAELAEYSSTHPPVVGDLWEVGTPDCHKTVVWNGQHWVEIGTNHELRGGKHDKATQA